MDRRACFHAGFLFLTVLLSACAPTVPEDEAHCGLTFRDSGDVRVFVVGHAFSLEDAASPEHFDVSFREDLRRIAPCLSASRPNLLLFPEDAGLVAWFSGRRALLARGSGDAETAFNAMYAGYYRQVDEYRRRFPGISAARALTLALGDVAWRAMDTTFGGIARRARVRGHAGGVLQLGAAVRAHGRAAPAHRQGVPHGDGGGVAGPLPCAAGRAGRLRAAVPAGNQLTRPRALSRQGFSAGVVLFEDDRSGYSRVRVTDPL